jgi:hypothetical protein
LHCHTPPWSQHEDCQVWPLVQVPPQQ